MAFVLRFVIDMFVHAADVSNPAKEWTSCKSWSFLIMDEFWAQGDRERDMVTAAHRRPCAERRAPRRDDRRGRPGATASGAWPQRTNMARAFIFLARFHIRGLVLSERAPLASSSSVSPPAVSTNNNDNTTTTTTNNNPHANDRCCRRACPWRPCTTAPRPTWRRRR